MLSTFNLHFYHEYKFNIFMSDCPIKSLFLELSHKICMYMFCICMKGMF